MDGTFEGYERGQWWESVILDSGEAGVPAALDDIDTELTRRGYTRTSRWHGPKLTRRGQPPIVTDQRPRPDQLLNRPLPTHEPKP
ncbi:hypothetical protein [Nocardia sp. CY41]|uniref:hypothetical protein n=1 Tax=Nocardia sp. CY41 TaxID=2608686 RepID=UPI00135C1E14|nr:hypothetical protein [Nocardia sp. CY41]